MNPQHINLQEALEKARSIVMTDEEREAQRRSFAYGNTKLHNDSITREIVDTVAERLAENGDTP